MHPLEVLSRERIVELMYGNASGISDRGIDVQILRLAPAARRRRAAPRYIQTVRGAATRSCRTKPKTFRSNAPAVRLVVRRQ